jgi:dTDP-4-dehydrorhamnose reductase
VINDQFGSLTWTYSLALQIKLILETDLQGIVHATAEGYCSWYEGAKYFLERMNIPHKLTPCTTREYSTPARRPANSILANEILRLNGLNRMNDWKQDIDSFVDRYRPDLIAEAEGGN